MPTLLPQIDGQAAVPPHGEGCRELAGRLSTGAMVDRVTSDGAKPEHSTPLPANRMVNGGSKGTDDLLGPRPPFTGRLAGLPLARKRWYRVRTNTALLRQRIWTTCRQAPLSDVGKGARPRPSKARRGWEVYLVCRRPGMKRRTDETPD